MDARPAFIIAISSFSTALTLWAKDFTEVKEDRSHCQISIRQVPSVASRVEFSTSMSRAANPFERVRMPRMRCAVPRFRKCWAVARPTPVLAPVMRTVLSAKIFGGGRVRVLNRWVKVGRSGIAENSSL